MPLERLTVSHLARLTQPLRLGDTLIAPIDRTDDLPLIYETALADRGWMDALPQDIAAEIRGKSLDWWPVIHYTLQIACGHGIFSRFTRPEEQPLWLRVVPAPLRAQLHVSRLSSDAYDPLGILPSLTHAGIGPYLVEEGGVSELLTRVFWLLRLQGIRQFGFLTYPIDRAAMHDGLTIVSEHFPHNRLVHSHNVALLARLIGRNVGLSDRDADLLHAAALVHDAATPIGGDTTKLVGAPGAFDEESNFLAYASACALDAHGDEYRRLWKRGLSVRRLERVVTGSARLLSELLDVCDRIAYVADDLTQVTMSHPVFRPKDVRLISSALAHRPDACHLWEDVELDEGRIVFGNPDRLVAFLRLRLLLFRGVYLNAQTRLHQFCLMTPILQYLLDRGELTWEELIDLRRDKHGRLVPSPVLWMADQRLERCMERVARVSFWSVHARSTDEPPTIETFDTLDEAMRRRTQVVTLGNPLVTFENLSYPLRSGAHWLTRDARGDARPLSDVLPETCAELETLTRIKRPFHLYILNGNHLPEAFTKILARHYQASLPS